MAEQDPKQIAKHLSALQSRIGSEQMQWGIGGSLIMNVGAAGMRLEHDGAIAVTDQALHFFRKSFMGSAHKSVPLSALRSVDTATARFDEGDVELVLLELDDPSGPWGIATTDEQRDFALDKFQAIETDRHESF